MIVTDDDGRVLLGKRLTGHPDIVGKWSTPGGRIEENEDRFAAARREFLEETGADLGSCDVIGFREHFRYGEHYFTVDELDLVTARHFEGFAPLCPQGFDARLRDPYSHLGAPWAAALGATAVNPRKRPSRPSRSLYRPAL